MEQIISYCPLAVLPQGIKIRTMNTKEEAIAKGIPLASPKNDKLRRAPWHNYSDPGLYMLTLVVKDRQRLLGHLVTEPYPKVELSELGRAILVDEFNKISTFYPNVKVWKKCIMPDHIHMIIEVSEAFPEKKHLGSIVAGFKTGCNRAYHRIYGLAKGVLFDSKYNDRIISPGLQYEHWKKYLDDNPRRLAIKHLYPEYFITKYAIELYGYNCQVFGNLFLLQIPDKMGVIVHRVDSEDDYSRKFNEWMDCGERGGILVGAFIAPREKAVMQEAIGRGYNIIQLCNNGFGPYYKPIGKFFDTCASGRLLQVAPWEYKAERKNITRNECLQLNALATKIANSALESSQS